MLAASNNTERFYALLKHLRALAGGANNETQCNAYVLRGMAAGARCNTGVATSGKSHLLRLVQTPMRREMLRHRKHGRRSVCRGRYTNVACTPNGVCRIACWHDGDSDVKKARCRSECLKVLSAHTRLQCGYADESNFNR